MFNLFLRLTTTFDNIQKLHSIYLLLAKLHNLMIFYLVLTWAFRFLQRKFMIPPVLNDFKMWFQNSIPVPFFYFFLSGQAWQGFKKQIRSCKLGTLHKRNCIVEFDCLYNNNCIQQKLGLIIYSLIWWCTSTRN